MRRVRSVFSFIFEELLIISKLSFPVYLTQLCVILVKIVSPIFAGHIGDGSTALAAVITCQLLTDTTGWVFLFNISSALDTLASQAFGAKNYKYLGVLLQRSILINLFMVIPTSIIWINTDNLMIILYQAPQIVHLAKQFMHIYIFLNPALAVIIPCMKSLQMQDIVLPSAIILTCGIVLEIVLCYSFIFLLEMGVYGAALGEVLAMYAMAVAHVLYVRFSSVWGRIWGGLSWEAWQNWGQFFYYGLPVLVTDLCEVLSIQLGGFVVGIVSTQPEVEISVYSILAYLDLLIYTLPSSLATVMAIRIGNLIGDRDISKVKKLTALAVTTQVALSFIQSIILITGRSVWGSVFSKDPRVVSGLAHVMFIIVLYHPFDSLVAVFQGILRGAGKQGLGLIMACAFVSVAFPMAIGLCVGLKLSALGYFLGIMAGYFTRVCACFFVLLCCIKWNDFIRVDSVGVEQVSDASSDKWSSQNNESNCGNLILASNSSQSSPLIHQSNSETHQTSHRLTASAFFKVKCIFVVKKVVFMLALSALLIWMLSCKLSSNRVKIYVQDSYLQEPLEICCFQYIPVKNISHF